MRQIVSYIWARQYFRGNGNVERGHKVFAEKNCAAWRFSTVHGAAPVRRSLCPFRFRLLLLDYPAQLGPCLAVGAACWTAYFMLRLRLRAISI